MTMDLCKIGGRPRPLEHQTGGDRVETMEETGGAVGEVVMVEISGITGQLELRW